MLNKASYDTLTAYGIKPTMQRLAVIGYLLEHHNHPSPEEIYSALADALPTFSRATVYNTLGLLEERGAVVRLNIDERRTCYDAVVEPHAHFLCRQCGRLLDAPFRHKKLNGLAELPEGCHVEHTHVCYQGLCAECKENLALAGRKAEKE